MPSGLRINADPQTAFGPGADLGTKLKAFVGTYLPANHATPANDHFASIAVTVEYLATGSYLAHYDFPSGTTTFLATPWVRRQVFATTAGGAAATIDVTFVDDVTDAIEVFNSTTGLALDIPLTFIALDYSQAVSG